MRRILIAALFGAPLLIAGPAMAAVGKTHLQHDATPALAGGAMPAVLDVDLAEKADETPAPLQLAHDRRDNPLWWLQVGIGNQWRGDHGPNRRWWDKDRHHHGKHWKKKHRHKHYSKHRGWDRHHGWDRHRDWDRDRRHRRDWDDDRRRHRDWDRDWDRDRDHRWGKDHHRR